MPRPRAPAHVARNVYLWERQDERLRWLSAKDRTSASALIREAVELYLLLRREDFVGVDIAGLSVGARRR